MLQYIGNEFDEFNSTVNHNINKHDKTVCILYGAKYVGAVKPKRIQFLFTIPSGCIQSLLACLLYALLNPFAGMSTFRDNQLHCLTNCGLVA